MREAKVDEKRQVSNHAILASQTGARLQEHKVTRVSYSAHRKAEKPTSIRVDYWDGLHKVATEWICPLHGGFATGKAQKWIDRRTPDIDYRRHLCEPTHSGIRDIKESSSGSWSIESWIDTFADELLQPSRIVVNHKEKFPEIVRHFFESKVVAA